MNYELTLSSSFFLQNRVNITTGAQVVVKSPVWPGASGSNNINAMGYSLADNFLYAALSQSPYSLIRIAGNGDATTVASFNTTIAYNCGDIDDRSSYWATLYGGSWTQVDLLPGSATFGKLVANGTATSMPSGYRVYDWVYVPGGGDALYGIANPSDGSRSVLMSFGRANKTWTQLTDFKHVAGSNQWGALYASDDGYLFGSENNAGVIWKFPLPFKGPSVNATFVTTCNPSSLNDGARCLKAAAA